MDISAIKKDIKSKTREAMHLVGYELEDKGVETITEFYGEYIPTLYNRTYQMYEAVKPHTVSSLGLGATVKIKMSNDGMGHSLGNADGKWPLDGEPWSEEDVFNSVMKWGTHGGTDAVTGVFRSGIPVWDTFESHVSVKYRSWVCNALRQVGL